MGDGRPGGIEKIAHLFLAAGDTFCPGDGNGSATKRVARAPQAGDAGGRPAADGTGSTAGPGIEAGADAGAGETPSVSPSDSFPSDTAEPEAYVSAARIVAVLSSHLGPRAGPAAEACARLHARRGLRVAMLYGPAEHACLHRFVARSEGLSSTTGGNGQTRLVGGKRAVGAREPCEVLLLPDWVFQFDLWPADRPVASVCVAYTAGSQGLMAAYGALKGFIARFGRPRELSAFAFGCDPKEAEWGRQRLAEMSRRFLSLEPSFVGPCAADVPVEAGELLALADGPESVTRLLMRAEGSSGADLEVPSPDAAESRSEAPEPVPPEDVASEPVESGTTAQAEVLLPVERAPSEGVEVLQALLGHLHVGCDAIAEVWRRDGMAGTFCGTRGFVAGMGPGCDVLGFALWLYRRARTAGRTEPETVTIAVRGLEDWQLEAGAAMPVPVRWLRWRAFELAGRIGLLFEPV